MIVITKTISMSVNAPRPPARSGRGIEDARARMESWGEFMSADELPGTGGDISWYVLGIPHLPARPRHPAVGGPSSGPSGEPRFHRLKRLRRIGLPCAG